MAHCKNKISILMPAPERLETAAFQNLPGLVRRTGRVEHFKAHLALPTLKRAVPQPAEQSVPQAPVAKTSLQTPARD